MSKIVELLKREPVRVYLYTLIMATAGLLVALGVITATLLPAIGGLVVAALAVPSPVESLRSRVSPADPPA